MKHKQMKPSHVLWAEKLAHEDQGKFQAVCIPI